MAHTSSHASSTASRLFNVHAIDGKRRRFCASSPTRLSTRRRPLSRAIDPCKAEREGRREQPLGALPRRALPPAPAGHRPWFSAAGVGTAQQKTQQCPESLCRQLLSPKRDTKNGPQRQTPECGSSLSDVRHGDSAISRNCRGMAAISVGPYCRRKNKDCLAGAAGFEPLHSRLMRSHLAVPNGSTAEKVEIPRGHCASKLQQNLAERTGFLPRTERQCC
jgi:hypothetical protein